MHPALRLLGRAGGGLLDVGARAVPGVGRATGRMAYSGYNVVTSAPARLIGRMATHEAGLPRLAYGAAEKMGRGGLKLIDLQYTLGQAQRAGALRAIERSTGLDIDDALTKIKAGDLQAPRWRLFNPVKAAKGSPLQFHTKYQAMIGGGAATLGIGGLVAGRMGSPGPREPQAMYSPNGNLELVSPMNATGDLTLSLGRRR